MKQVKPDNIAAHLDTQVKRQTGTNGILTRLARDCVVRTALFTAINIPPKKEQITTLEADIRWDISMRYLSIRHYGENIAKTAQTHAERTFAVALCRGRYDDKLRVKAEASTGFRYLRKVTLDPAVIDKVEDGENTTRKLIGIVGEREIEKEVMRRLRRHGVAAARWAQAAAGLNPRVFSNVKGASNLPSFKRRDKSGFRKKGDGKSSHKLVPSDDGCVAAVYAEHRLFGPLKVNGIIKRAGEISLKIMQEEYEQVDFE